MKKNQLILNRLMLPRIGFLVAMSIAGGLSSAANLSLANSPLFLAGGVQPNIYFIIDDSGSMKWETLYSKEGTRHFNMTNNALGEDRVRISPPITTTGHNGWFYDEGRSKWVYGWIEEPNRDGLLRSCLGVNTLHYDRTKTYTPWVGKDKAGNAYANQPITSAKKSPFDSNERTNLTAKNSADDRPGYFPWYDLDGDNVLDVYVDINNNGRKDVFIDRNGNGTFDGWSDTNGDGKVDPLEVETELECPELDAIRATANLTTTKAMLNSWLVAVEDMPVAEQTNYANWYSYYRKRTWVTKRALSTIIDESTARMGITTIKNDSDYKRPVLDVDNISTPLDITAGINKDNLMATMFGIPADGGTPLRTGLQYAGEYFRQAPGTGPIVTKEQGGSCQQNFAILMTDGVWTGQTSPNVGNQDADGASPYDGGLYADTYSNTLADVAMKYYKTDLQPSLEDKVPLGTREINKDENPAQHLVTYTVGFGVYGTLGESEKPGVPGWGGWPEPKRTELSTIDDLRHAAYNGRGLFLNAGKPDELIEYLGDAVNDISKQNASASAVSVNTGSISSSTMLFQAEFNNVDWNGKINGIPVKLDGSLDLNNSELASKVPLPGDRKIITYDGTDGIPFQWANLSAAQKALIGSQEVFNYTRGDRSLEGENGDFRTRELELPSPGPLGDIINSAPAFVANPEALYSDDFEGGKYSKFRQNPDGDGKSKDVGGLTLYRTPVLYVGSNDGMLHAFNVDPDLRGTPAFGLELFAYVPTPAMKRLPDIASKSYNHSYTVDGSPEVADVYFNSSWRTVLVSGMNAGGQGLFALDVSNPNVYTTETTAAATVLWEFTDVNDQDLGYTFGKPTITKANNGKWVAIFGNGYNSTVADGQVGSGYAVLYIVELATGNLIKKIDTKVNVLSTPNGLSSPTTLDVDNDYDADYVYAGDLEGNMWKFDISSSDPAQWDVAFKNGTTALPLYTACTTADCSITNRQPITVKPQVGFNKGATGMLVYFGTGSYFQQNDNKNKGLQSFYAIWDKGFSTSPVFNKSHLLEQKILQELHPKNKKGDDIGELNRITTANPIIWHRETGLPKDGTDDGLLVDTHLGWYMDMVNTEKNNTDGRGERFISDPQLRDDQIIFVTAIPDANPCAYGGSSWFMQLNAISGSRPETPAIDVDGDGDIDETDFLLSLTNGSVPSSGLKSDSLATQPVCITLPNGSETCKSNTSDATILEVVRDAGVLLGRWMWRELRIGQ